MQYSSAGRAVKLTILVTFLGTVSGLRFVAPNLEPAVTAATSGGMLITYAVICRVFAAQSGRPRNPWTLAGLLAGIFATAVLLVLLERDARRA